ncbi:5343_t:CDS:2, partial [Gigaspora rosea]
MTLWSKINSLKEQIFKLIAENTELKKKNANLKQDKEEIEARFIKLEQNDKDTASENAELKARVVKLEQKQLQTDKKNNFIIKSDDNTKEIDQSSVNTISTNMKNSNDTLASNIFDNTSNSDDPKLSEDIEIDDFLDSIYKEKIIPQS